jgi:hypothetical protein
MAEFLVSLESSPSPKRMEFRGNFLSKWNFLGISFGGLLARIAEYLLNGSPGEMKFHTQMMNMIPGKYCGKLALVFMLIHGVHSDPRTWLPFFLICYFHHKKDSNDPRSKNQAHKLDGIIIGQSATSNAILV